ncbi:hypothetical protein [Streptomyces sp. NPDC005799]|uniref:hypothetical protein n=1 Tax=Streptomyces sp. NPDC005799 TaxID=3154678 RepID=UPI0033C8BDFC
MTTDSFDVAAFKSLCAALDIETHVVTDTFGRQDVRIDRNGLNKLIAAGLLPEDPTTHPAWTEVVRRRQEGGTS